MSQYTTRTSCRICGCQRLTPLFSLGEHYISDFVEKDRIRSGPKAPLELVLCTFCTLVQLKHTVPMEHLYRERYWYRSGVTQTMRDALADIAHTAEEMVKPAHDDLVLDIGSNDGTLLRSYRRPCYKIGVEPAKNLAEEGRRGIDLFVSGFWGTGTLGSIWKQGQKARIVTAIGMMYDLEDPNSFVREIAECLAPDGLFIAQLMCLKNMVDIGDVGNINHEHLEYYSLRSLQHLLGRHGLVITRVDANSVNGQSYRLYIRHRAAAFRHENYYSYLSQESDLAKPEFYARMLDRMVTNRDQLRRLVETEVARGKSVWVYGASTKGNTLLQWYDLKALTISGAADRSPEKWEKFTVGTGIEIFSEQEARRHKPDYFLVLPYAFMSEFIEREREWLLGGGKFIVPLPEVKVIGKEVLS